MQGHGKAPNVVCKNDWMPVERLYWEYGAGWRGKDYIMIAFSGVGG